MGEAPVRRTLFALLPAGNVLGVAAGWLFLALLVTREELPLRIISGVLAIVMTLFASCRFNAAEGRGAPLA